MWDCTLACILSSHQVVVQSADMCALTPCLPACLPPPPPAPLCGVCCSVSRGFSIKLLKFDDQGKLKLSSVNRQMTQQEQQQLVSPGVK